MGIRLYPNTEDHAAIETLANVPAGTYAAYETWKAANPEAPYSNPNHDALNYARWERMMEQEALGDLSHFLVNGYGKLPHTIFTHLGAAGHDENCGSTTDEVLIREICRHYSMPPHELLLKHGVAWC